MIPNNKFHVKNVICMLASNVIKVHSIVDIRRAQILFLFSWIDLFHIFYALDVCALIFLSHIFCLSFSLVYFISRLFLSFYVLQSKRKIQDTHAHFIRKINKSFLFLQNQKEDERGSLRERDRYQLKRIIPMMNQSQNRYGIFSSLCFFLLSILS